MVEVSKEHNAHFIGGLVKTAKTVAEEHVGDAENFAVMTRYGFGDIVLSMITAGIYTYDNEILHPGKIHGRIRLFVNQAAQLP